MELSKKFLKNILNSKNKENSLCINFSVIMDYFQIAIEIAIVDKKGKKMVFFGFMVYYTKSRFKRQTFF